MQVRRVGVALSALALFAVVGVATAPPASAAWHQDGHLYVYWDWSGSGYWNVDQYVIVRQKAASTYWAQYWTWTDATYGGYVGLQTDGYRGDGTIGEMAIFSLWNANAASGPLCVEFGGEGVGYSCRLAYPVSTGVTYRYRIWRLDADSGGQWWGAWILNYATGVESYLGKIRVASSHRLMTSVMNFTEYFGPAVPCNQVPKSIADFTQPAANSQGGGRYQYGSRFSSSYRGSCTGGSVTVVSYGWTNAARVTQGG